MSEVSQQAISILVVEDDPGDFGLIRAYMRLSKLGISLVARMKRSAMRGRSR